MSSHHYYQERLGLDPTEARANGTRDGKNTGADFKTFGGYEESLSKFKGIVYTLNIYQLIGRGEPVTCMTCTGVLRAVDLTYLYLALPPPPACLTCPMHSPPSSDCHHHPTDAMAIGKEKYPTDSFNVILKNPNDCE